MELYNIRELKVIISKVISTVSGNSFRHQNTFQPTSIQDCRYIFLLYSNRTRFIEIGFNSIAVYKILRFIFQEKSINKLILRIIEYANVIRNRTT